MAKTQDWSGFFRNDGNLLPFWGLDLSLADTFILCALREMNAKYQSNSIFQHNIIILEG